VPPSVKKTTPPSEILPSPDEFLGETYSPTKPVDTVSREEYQKLAETLKDVQDRLDSLRTHSKFTQSVLEAVLPAEKDDNGQQTGALQMVPLGELMDRLDELEQAVVKTETGATPPIPEMLYPGLTASAVFTTALAGAVQGCLGNASIAAALFGNKIELQRSYARGCVRLAMEVLKASLEPLPKLAKQSGAV